MSKKNSARPTKVIIRHLPPDMDEAQLLETLEPLPPMKSKLFAVGVSEFKSEHRYNRAYFDFVDFDDILSFSHRWDDYVFVSGNGSEYRAIVEFAPYSKMPSTKTPRVDSKVNTMDVDTTYARYLKQIDTKKDEIHILPEMMLEQLNVNEAKDKELYTTDTPLVLFLKMSKEARYENRVQKDLEYTSRYQKRRGMASAIRRQERRLERRSNGRGDADKPVTILNRKASSEQRNYPVDDAGDCRPRYDSANTEQEVRSSSPKASRYRGRKERRRRESEPKKANRYARTTDCPESIRESMKDLRIVKDSSPKRDKKRERKEPPSRYKDRPTMALYDPSKRLAERRNKFTDNL